MRLAAVLPLFMSLVLLVACGGEAPPDTARRGAVDTSGRSATPATPAPAGPVTEFDGRYLGVLALLPDRTGECPRPTAQQRELLVERGRATLLLNPEVGQVQTGTVSADGSARLVDRLDRAIATSGQFIDGSFVGTYHNNRCSYALRLRRG